ncbi:MAG: Ankyrin repeats (3 copies) [Syntrophorhabdus sp. PtaB.Bin047]|jgi:ankyrin repeat protein|nr:MAG: Ankyrin repeats (3 copies) [Syntrophorhabdus sp. PtaB.Bin047]
MPWVNAADKNGATAVMWASWHRSVRSLKALLAARANSNAKANNGLTALKIARDKNYNDIVRMLEEAGAR